MGEILEVGADGEGKSGLAVEGAEVGRGGGADGSRTEGEVAGLETGRGTGVDDSWRTVRTGERGVEGDRPLWPQTSSG